LNGKLEAIEVKNYDLNNESGVKIMYREIVRQVQDRLTHMPRGSTQRIVINTQGRGYSQELTTLVMDTIKNMCNDFYPNIPVQLMGG
jgi:hypothetical protein